MSDKLGWFQFYPRDHRGSRWLTLSVDDLNESVERPACYAIYIDGELAYIGQTTNFRYRMESGHRMNWARYSNAVTTRWGIFREVKVKAHFGVRFGDWAMREVRLITRLKPRLNCVGSIRPRAKRGEAA